MNRKKTTQKGSALVYILVALAILAALTATFMGNSGQQTTSQRGFDLVAELNTQIQFIRSAIQECVLTYPNGDSTMGPNPVGTGSGVNPVRPYPLNTNNTYMAPPITGSPSVVKSIRCPGNPGNSNNHTAIFSPANGKFFPPAPKLMSEWTYVNGTDGVFVMIDTAQTDAFIETALRKVDAMYAKCEVQYIDATAGAVQVQSDYPGNACAAGRKCLLVHIVTTGTTLYPGEVGCP